MNKFKNMYGSTLYGESSYGDPVGVIIPENYRYPNLMKYLPIYYHRSLLTIRMQIGFAKELGLLELYKNDLMRQFFISTATWGLAYYEKELGITPNPNLTYEQRREVIIAKLRGRGTTTKEMIKLTAESFSGGEVDIIEHTDDYSFTVKFVGTIGIPTNMKSFLQMLDEIKPAHLDYNIEYTYTTCGMLIDWDTICDTLTDNKITCEGLRTFTPRRLD